MPSASTTRAAVVDGIAEGDVETLLIPTEGLRALLVAEAELGERIMRALILRRVALLEGGAAEMNARILDSLGFDQVSFGISKVSTSPSVDPPSGKLSS